jgi:hypothetical protein
MRGDHWMVGYAVAGACALVSIILLGISFKTNSEWLRGGAFGSYVAALISALFCFVMATR